MALQSARLSGDPVLGRCLAGNHRMFAPEENLSVMRVQEALRRLDFDPGELDGIFGEATGAAVSSFKEAPACHHRIRLWGWVPRASSTACCCTTHRPWIPTSAR